jgi:hypothetical protein
MTPGTVVVLWGVRDKDSRLYFTTKIQAERAARLLFPLQTVHERYARIYFIESQPHEDLM